MDWLILFRTTGSSPSGRDQQGVFAKRFFTNVPARKKLFEDNKAEIDDLNSSIKAFSRRS